MLQTIKRLTKHSAVYGVGHIISRSIGFLLLPIHTNFLPPEEYRNAALLFSALAFLNVFFSYGMDVAFLRFFIVETGTSKKRTIFSTAFWMIFSTGLVFSVLIVLFPAPFSAAVFQSRHLSSLVRLGGGILLADALALLPFLVLRAEERSGSFVLLRTLNIAANLGLNVLYVVVWRKGVPGIFIANLISSVFTLVTLIPIFIRWLRPKFDRTMLSELLRFGLPYVPTGLAVLILDQIGRFFLDRMIGKEAAGIFSAGYKLGMFMALVVAAFRFAWHPFFLSTAKQEDAPRIFARVLTYFLFVTGSLFLFVSIFIREIVRIRFFGITLFGKGYETGISIVPIVMLAYIGYGVYANFVVGIYLKKKTAYLPFVTGLGALVDVVGNFLLIPRFGIAGAAWSTFFAYLVMALSLSAVSQRLYPVPYEIGRIMKLVVVFAALFGLGMLILANSATWIRFSVVFFLLPVLLWIVRFFTSDEKEALARMKTKMGRNVRNLKR
jgi:O-antigen/teichoic acid export membrane protein